MSEVKFGNLCTKKDQDDVPFGDRSFHRTIDHTTRVRSYLAGRKGP